MGARAPTEGFGYRIVYVEPSHLAEALRVLRGRPCPLPFVGEPVSTNARLSRAVEAAFRAPLEPLAADSLVVDLARGIDGRERGGRPAAPRVDAPAIERARQFLDAERTRVVHSAELESITGLTRYDLARQFRIMFGTSPTAICSCGASMRPGADSPSTARWSRWRATPASPDQAHFTRAFKSAFGLTPARYRALRTGQAHRIHA